MSLRYKILIAIISVMVLILGLLTLSLYVDTETRIKATQNEIAQLNLKIVQDWLANINDWKILQGRLNSTGLFSKWVIVDSDFEVLSSSAPLSSQERTAYKQDNDLMMAMRIDSHVFINGSNVSTWLIMPKDGKSVGVKMDMQYLTLSKFDPWDSIVIILLIMPLGTILLILSIYFLLTRLVIKPIETLSKTSSHIAKGDYNVEIKPVSGNDEVTNLINTFNLMLNEIKEHRGHMETKIEEAQVKIKTTEEQLIIAQRLSATGTLAAGIAHEINNPLGGIINAAESLKGGKLDKEKADEYLDLIIDGLDRIAETVKKILQFFPRKLAPQAVDLKPVIDRAILLVQHRLESNNITVENSVPLSLPSIFGEGNELQQVFLNLMMNAIDAILTVRQQKPDANRGKIEIFHEVNARALTISVKDDGIGMSENEIKQAFDLFYTSKEPGKGTGLGLSVAFNIIENHGGKITLESKRNQGTTAKITLPIMKETIKSIVEPNTK
ncbi:MAG: HAMP domain-containing histidine kinase [Planctomycetes bacterium]|nr:HAMP domain-containing histidine kinase [Planctomycetota bacterium]